MKRFLKRSLTCILILLLVVNFSAASFTGVSFAAGEGEPSLIDSIFTGLIGLITWIPRAIIMALLTGVNVLIGSFVNLGMGVDAIDGAIDVFITPYHVFFNQIPILDINFFNFDVESDTVLKFREAAAGWYYTMRLIAAMILVVILIYIGIRMALTSIAREKAEYKKMLVDWVTSLALLFLLHYIIMFVFSCNNAFVEALKDACSQADLTSFIDNLTAQALGLETSSAIAAIILYGIIIGQTVSFIFAYVKRMLTIGFLIMIAPLITITYSIDKIGDQKAQALNTWLKEFVFNILIQPFHCILFAAFASVAFEIIGVGEWTAGSSLAEMILAVACIQFIKTGEDLIRKIFSFADSGAGTLKEGATLAMAAVGTGTKVGTAVGAGVAKTKNFVSKNSDKIAKATNKLSNKVGTLNNRLTGKVDSTGALTDKGKTAAEEEAKKRTAAGRKGADGKALTYDQNLADVTQQIQSGQRFKLQDKTNSLKQTAERKRNAAIDKKMVEMYGEEGLEKIRNSATDKEWNEKREAAGKAIDKEKKDKAAKREANQQKRKEISGVAKKFWENNGQKIASSTASVVTGLIGLGAGGNFASFEAARQVGAGLVTGYMTNTDKTLAQQVGSGAIAYNNWNQNNPDFDLEKSTFAIHASAQNGAFEKVEEKLDQILDKLENLSEEQRQAFNADMRYQLQTDPSNFTEDFLRRTARNYGVEEGSAEYNTMHKFADLLVTNNYASTINNSVSTGRNISDVARIAVAEVDAREVAQHIKVDARDETNYSQVRQDISHLEDTMEKTDESAQAAKNAVDNQNHKPTSNN